MIKDLATVPIPNSTMMMGIQAMGGRGRMISKIGRTSLSKGLYQPMRSPMGRPMTSASINPYRASLKLANILANRVFPSGLGSVTFTKMARITSMGDAKRRLSTIPRLHRSCQIRRKARMLPAPISTAMYSSRFLAALSFSASFSNRWFLDVLSICSPLL